MPPTLRTCTLAALLAAIAPSALPAMPDRPAAAPASPPHLRPAVRPVAAAAGRLETEHFELLYSPSKVTAEMAEQAGREAEAAWARCAEVFGRTPKGRLRLDLSPDFFGATGFARRGDPESKDVRKRPLIGVRYADLEYLGLTGPYVITHEVAHIFSEELAPTNLGEGIADWATGSFSGIPMRPWWGKALRGEGLWVDPEALFVTGEFDARPEVDEVIRTAQYVEAALLVRFLVERGGLETFRAFALEYDRFRGVLNSNEDRRALKPRRRPRDSEGRADPRVPPDGPAVRAVFEKHYGENWERLRAQWEQQMESDPAPPDEAERLVLSQRLYGAVRNWETWAMERRPAPDHRARERVREAFTRANRALRVGSLEEARQAFGEAQALVDQLRRPRAVT